MEWTTDGVVVGGVRQDIRLGVAFEMLLEETAPGQLRGRAEGSARLMGTSDHPRVCTAENVGGEEYSFDVTGTRSGSRVGVELPRNLKMAATIIPTECPAPQPYTAEPFRIPYLSVMSGVLENGFFTETVPGTLQIGAIPGAVVYTVEFEERAVPE